ncbi:transcription factor SPT20 homolog isoform X1 [Meleagris gallopavo]|uniref:transcription factor SPT20 homolog isoform X1 n=1 Tax=Meleagris gallopavo TaxID=9103 RepID=UPI0009398997|nr:transcription factor SPT20 homolog isoform X1 [Meleagris gallopavo]
MSLSQALPVMTIPLSTMVTSITTGTTSTQVMANPAGLNFINVVGSVCGAQTLMSGSNPMLGCNTGAIAPAGINLSGILPSGGLVPSALPAAMQSASQAGSPFGLKNASNLRPLNLLQGSDQGPSNQDQALSAQQAAVINLTGVGNFMQPQATAVAILAASNGYGSSSSTSSSSATSAAFRQPLKK